MRKRPGVVVGVDGSLGSRAALQFALEDAARRRVGVRVVWAFPSSLYWPDAYGLSAPPTIGQVKRDLRKAASRMLEEILAEHSELAAVPVERHAVEGHPAKVLVEQALGADLLVVGHRGRGGFASALLGSVGLHCVLHAQCPVMVVRPVPQPQAAAEVEVSGKHSNTEAGPVDSIVGPLY